MGNCAYRLGRYAEALLHYRRAELRLPRDGRLRFNRSLAEEQLVLEKAPIESFAASVEELLDFFTPGEFLAVVGLLQGVGLMGLVLLRRRRGLRGVISLASRTECLIPRPLFGAERLRSRAIRLR